MRLLLDTHVLLWWWMDDSALPSGIRAATAREETTVFVSAASAWEIAIKVALGRLEAPVDDFAEMVQASGFDPLPITLTDAARVRHLPPHHGDPFDRMLIAQAQEHGLTLASVDRQVALYDVPLLTA